ncbi:MAG: glycerol-3-phosphate acyltransferase [Verrucomicrobia bacterium]|nr:glycerol-3-phosphate acyltransferase [Verrucomicrobiota bacterium]
MTFALADRDFVAVLGAYLLGCFASGYYLVRWRTGRDIRNLGSGSVGARNVGRNLGPAGFALTLLLDLAKGAVAVELPGQLHATSWARALALAAVVAGHVWPAQLNFRGGKGVAPSLGALLAYDYSIALILLAGSLIAMLVLRSFVLSGMLAYALTPLALLIGGWPAPAVVGTSLAAMIILFAHRKNVRDEINRWRA